MAISMRPTDSGAVLCAARRRQGASSGSVRSSGASGATAGRRSQVRFLSNSAAASVPKGFNKEGVQQRRGSTNLLEPGVQTKPN